jgi:hypothetical protein
MDDEEERLSCMQHSIAPTNQQCNKSPNNQEHLSKQTAFKPLSAADTNKQQHFLSCVIPMSQHRQATTRSTLS